MKEESILLKDLQDLLKNKDKYFQSEQKGHTGIPNTYDEGEQGEYNKIFKYYKHPGLPVGIFMRETWNTDSYGSNEAIVSVEFVKGKEKQITVFEPI